MKSLLKPFVGIASLLTQRSSLSFIIGAASILCFVACWDFAARMELSSFRWTNFGVMAGITLFGFIPLIRLMYFERELSFLKWFLAPFRSFERAVNYTELSDIWKGMQERNAELSHRFALRVTILGVASFLFSVFGQLPNESLLGMVLPYLGVAVIHCTMALIVEPRFGFLSFLLGSITALSISLGVSSLKAGDQGEFALGVFAFLFSAAAMVSLPYAVTAFARMYFSHPREGGGRRRVLSALVVLAGASLCYLYSGTPVSAAMYFGFAFGALVLSLEGVFASGGFCNPLVRSSLTHGLGIFIGRFGLALKKPLIMASKKWFYPWKNSRYWIVRIAASLAIALDSLLWKLNFLVPLGEFLAQEGSRDLEVLSRVEKPVLREVVLRGPNPKLIRLS